MKVNNLHQIAHISSYGVWVWASILCQYTWSHIAFLYIYIHESHTVIYGAHMVWSKALSLYIHRSHTGPTWCIILDCKWGVWVVPGRATLFRTRDIYIYIHTLLFQRPSSIIIPRHRYLHTHTHTHLHTHAPTHTLANILLQERSYDIFIRLNRSH